MIRPFAVFAAVFFLAVPGFSAEKEAAKTAPPTIETIKAAIEQQNKASFEVKYKITSEMQNAGDTQKAWGFGGGNTTTLPAGKPVNFNYKYRYVRTSDAIFMTDGQGEKSAERVEVAGLKETIGKSVSTPGFQDQGSVDRQAPYRTWAILDHIESILLPFVPRSDDPNTAFFYGWLKYGKVLEKQEVVDGHKCWVVDITDTGDSVEKHIQFWLDPSIGYNPRRTRAFANNSGDSEWITTRELKDYKEISKGIWFPQTMYNGTKYPTGKYPDHAATITVTELAAKPGLSKDDVLIKIPSGSRIIIYEADGSHKPVIWP